MIRNFRLHHVRRTGDAQANKDLFLRHMIHVLTMVLYSLDSSMEIAI